MSCRRWSPLLVEGVCGTLEESRQQSLDEHLASCPVCAAEMAEMQAALDLATEHGCRTAQASRLDHVWTRLHPRLDAADAVAARRQVERTGWWRWAGLPALAATLVVGMVLGAWLTRYVSRPPALTSPSYELAADELAADELDARLEAYLARTKPLLMAVANRDLSRWAASGDDRGVEQRLAARLAAEGAALGQGLDEARRRRELALVVELELILRQIANLPARGENEGLEMIQETLQLRALLFEVGLHELRLSSGPKRGRTT